MTHTYNIAGMTCNGCVVKVKSELLKLGDITNAEIRLTAPQATITMQNHIPTSTLQDAVHSAGNYTITDSDTSMHHTTESKDRSNSYFPIFLIFGYIAGITLIIQSVQHHFDWMHWMSHFMAGFFLVFSFFKVMNLRGFAEGYRTYDVVAKAIPTYGFIYPFIELGLGIAYITGWQPLTVNIITLIVMSVSSIGVIQSLLKKTKFECACLGTVIKLPLSKVTLFEDLLMVAMSIVMIASI